MPTDIAPESTAVMQRPDTRRLQPYLPLRPKRSLDRGDGAIAGALFLASLALYTATMTRGLSAINADSNELVTKSALLEVAHQPGSPFYLWIGKLFTLLPFGQIATRVTWLSAVGAALVVAMLFILLTRFVSGERLIAAGVAVAFALSLTFWSQAVIAELYTLNLAFVSLVVLCLLEYAASRSANPWSPEMEGPARRWLLAGAGIFGASLGVHLSNTMFLPCFALLLLLGWPVARPAAGNGSRWLAPLKMFVASVRSLDWKGALAAIGIGALGLLPFMWLALNLDAFPPSEGRPLAAPGWPLFYEFTLNAFAGWRFAIPVPSWPDQAVLVLHLLALNYGPLLLLGLLLGLWRMLITNARLFFLFVSMALANFIFFGTYRVPDTDVFLIPGFWALLPATTLGLVWVAQAVASLARRAARSAQVARLLSLAPRAVGVAAIVALCLLQLPSNLAVNNRAPDTAFKDFYGNVLASLPAGAWVYQRGAALGYDLLYQTRLYGVRPDLNLVVGPRLNETQSPPWPPGPAYSTSLRHDVFLPAFISDSSGANNKWFSPELFGMFHGLVGIRRSWMTLYRLSPNDQPPQDWLIPNNAAGTGLGKPMDVKLTSDLTLVGVDMPDKAVAGRPLRITRYWRSTSAGLPAVATVFGDHAAIEVHTPLLEQLSTYLDARNISSSSLPDYVIRDEYRIIIPSDAKPGYYPISTATIANRLWSMIVDPVSGAELLPREVTLGQVLIEPGSPAPDPLTLTAPGPVEEAP